METPLAVLEPRDTTDSFPMHITRARKHNISNEMQGFPQR